MIGIINYGSGNLSAFINVFKSLDKKTMIINEPADLKFCSKRIILILSINIQEFFFHTKILNYLLWYLKIGAFTF